MDFNDLRWEQFVIGLWLFCMGILFLSVGLSQLGHYLYKRMRDR